MGVKGARWNSRWLPSIGRDAAELATSDCTDDATNKALYQGKTLPALGSLS